MVNYWNSMANVPSGFADNVDNVGDDWGSLTNKPSGFADNVDNIGGDWGGITGKPAGFADDVDNVGIASETDPTVTASVKDGVSWAEVSGKPVIAIKGTDVYSINGNCDGGGLLTLSATCDKDAGRNNCGAVGDCTLIWCNARRGNDAGGYRCPNTMVGSFVQ